jgi:transcriptional regulator with XRE-family HTH domain
MDPGSAGTRINQYERGKHTPDCRTLAALARVLGVPLAYFYAEEDGLAAWILRYDPSLSPIG